MPARPTPELLEKLRRAKRDLRRARTELSLREKVAQVIELQRAYLPLLKRRRPLRPWEQPWDITP